MMFKVLIKRVGSEFLDTHYMDAISLMKLASRIDDSREFKVGEKYYIPSEIESFRADKYYLSEVDVVDE